MKKILIYLMVCFLLFGSKLFSISKAQIKEVGGHRIFEVEYENDKDTIGSFKGRLADFLGVSSRDVVLTLPKVELKEDMKDIESLCKKSGDLFYFKLDPTLDRIKRLEEESQQVRTTIANMKKNMDLVEKESSIINNELNILKEERNQPRY